MTQPTRRDDHTETNPFANTTLADWHDACTDDLVNDDTADLSEDSQVNDDSSAPAA